MLKIAYHNAYIHPLPDGHRFPMMKYELIPQQLLYEGIVDFENFFQPALVDFDTICLSHDPTYVRQLLDLSLDAKMIRRIGFPLSQELVDRERYLIDGTIKAALYAKKFGVAFNIAGGTHHAGYDFGEGFCLLNDQAIAASYLLKEKISSNILIIDLDVHQGNGTANIFRNNPDVFTFSMHGEKNFPFVKEISSLDVGLDDGITDADYLAKLDHYLLKIFDEFKPDFVFYQAGVDILETDKLGKLKVSKESCKIRDYKVLSACRDRAIPVQVSMGGGYSPAIKDIVDAHVETYKVAVHVFGF